MDTENMKPCTRCGQTPELNKTSVYWVGCPSCEFQAFETESEAIEFWNKTLKQSDYVHPDYQADELPIDQLLRDTEKLRTAVLDTVLDVQHTEDEARQWLGTFEINGQRCQLQLVMTNVDSHFVDEG